jgi:hypothetical protein
MANQAAISCDPVPLVHLQCEPWEDPDVKADRLLLSTLNEWCEEYTWNYTARKVAVSWLEFRKEGGYNPRLLRTLWKSVVKEETIGPILRETYGNSVKEIIRNSHSVEWNLEILKNLTKLRMKDAMFDYKMACLVYYNEEIPRKERDRRLDSLWIPAVNKAVDDCNALRILLESPT